MQPCQNKHIEYGAIIAKVFKSDQTIPHYTTSPGQRPVSQPVSVHFLLSFSSMGLSDDPKEKKGEAPLFELILRDTLTHRRGRADTARHHLLQLVDVRGAAPLLVLDHVDAELHLGLLDELAVRAHPLLGVGPGEPVADERRRVQARQRDELPAVAQRRQAADVRLLLGAGHGRLPVEGGGEVVCESCV